jgi:hypothetical protein
VWNVWLVENARPTERWRLLSARCSQQVAVLLHSVPIQGYRGNDTQKLIATWSVTTNFTFMVFSHANCHIFISTWRSLHKVQEQVEVSAGICPQQVHRFWWNLILAFCTKSCWRIWFCRYCSSITHILHEAELRLNLHSSLHQPRNDIQALLETFLNILKI